MDLQRPDAGRQIQDAFQAAVIESSLNPLHEGVGTEAQVEIEFRRAIFNQQVLVTRLAIHYLYLLGSLRDSVEDGCRCCRRCCGRCFSFDFQRNGFRRPEVFYGCILQFFECKRLVH
jgi:hypothetical protein